MTDREVLRPGSNAALDAGCRCPVMDNAHGRGYLGGVKDPETGETVFVVNEECHIHGSERRTLNAAGRGRRKA